MSDLYDPMTLHKYVCYCYCYCYCCCCDLVESFAFPERCGAPSVCGSGAFLARLARPRQAAAMLVTAVTTATHLLMRMLGHRRDAVAAVTARRCRVTHVLSQQSHTRLPSRPTRHRPHTTTQSRLHIAIFHHYTGPTGPARTFLRPGSPRNSVGSVRVSDKVRAGPVGPV